MNAHPGTLGYSNSRYGKANVSQIGGVGTAFLPFPLTLNTGRVVLGRIWTRTLQISMILLGVCFANTI